MGQPLPDPNNGFCSETGVFHSIRPPVPLPPENTPLSAATYALSLHSTSPSPHSTALIDCATAHRISYSQFRHYVHVLSLSLRSEIGLSRNDVAFVLCPNSIRVPILYFALLSIGAAVSPANPLSTRSEITRQLNISKPNVAFATSQTAAKLAGNGCETVILIDSAEFQSMMTRADPAELGRVEVSQDDVAAVLFSSGTTGSVKGVAVTHRNLIASTANYYYGGEERKEAVALYMVPYFHVFGYHCCLKSVALGETVVVMEGRFELGKMLRAVEEHGVTYMAVVPPIVVAMVKSELTERYELGSLKTVGSGAAPLGVDLIEAFTKKLPGVSLYQGYGMTETTGAAFRVNPEEYGKRGTVGKLSGTYEAKIIDMQTGKALPPGKQGELWVRGPTIMKGYVDDPKANSEALVLGGWLRTGDVCYIDEQGFLFVVDRMKEMIKYKGYQVAPAELEQLLLSHPSIVDAAVMPYPDEEAGEVPLAFVVRCADSNLDQNQVIDFIATLVAPYKKIRRVAFVTSIPKSPSGKILRKELKNISLPLSKL